MNNLSKLIFESSKKYIIVEKDKKQETTILSKEECLKIKKLSVNTNKTLVIIKFNPGIIFHNNNILKIPIAKRIDVLYNLITNELKTNSEFYKITLIQMYFNSNEEIYKDILNSDVTVLAAM